MSGLVLSLFPGIGLLDMAFEEAGFCVVRGPDLLWGGDVHRFRPPAGRFDGIIGGPPCQTHSRFAAVVRATGKKTAADLIPEFVRCVEAAMPSWFLMENVEAAPVPAVDGYGIRATLLNNRWCGGEQNRLRRFSFGLRHQDPRGFQVATEALEPFVWSNTVLASGGVKPGTEHRRGSRKGNEYGYHGAKALAHAVQAQGLPPDFLSASPFTSEGKFRAIGNGVPLPMGRAVASAVLSALQANEGKAA